MALYVITEIIDTLPWYDVKVEIIANCGTTGTTDTTDSGLVMSIGELVQAIDGGNSQYKPGDLSITLRNIGGVLSTNVFNDNITAIELRIWASYDSGSTWENFFAGFVDHRTRGYEEFDTTLTGLRIYRVTAFDAFLTLREQSTTGFTTSPPANLITKNSVSNLLIRAGVVSTYGALDIDFASIDEILLAAIGQIPFISGAYAPSIQVDTSATTNQIRFTNGVQTHNDLSGAYAAWTIPTALLEKGFASLGSQQSYGESQWKASIYSSTNMLDAIRSINQTFLLYPRPLLIDSGGGSYVYTVVFEPFGNLTPGRTLIGSLGDFYLKDGDITQWYDSVAATTLNLPFTLAYHSTLGGKSRTFQSRFCTCADIGGPLYYMSKIEGQGMGLVPEYVSHGYGGQLLYFSPDSGTNMYNCFQMRHRSAQVVRPGVTTELDFSWYGIMSSLYDVLAVQAVSSILSRGVRRSYKAEYDILRDPGAAANEQLFALGPGIDTTIDSKTVKGYKTTRDIYTNTSKIDWLEESA